MLPTTAPELMPARDFENKFYMLTKVLKAFAYNLTKNSEDAKDLYQETAFRAMTNREKFKTGTNLKAWTFTIMKNIFINNYRKKMKANVIFDTTDNMFYLNSGKESIQNGGEGSILMKELNAMLETLDDSLKLPFLMHYRGYKYQEIADHFEMPLGTIKSRIFFARKEMKAILSQRYEDIERLKVSDY